MPEEGDGFDVYADAFTITITPFGANLSFSLREAHPSLSRTPQMTQLGTVRMSVEHLKTMVMIMRRQVLQVEAQMGVRAEVPREVLNQLGVSPEDWESFWR
ncbi:MAG: hypothetical protein HY681_13460 [Chloroflexi bacterium]|nr:hypothetical protein [Chloroflexota bacterium]